MCWAKTPQVTGESCDFSVQGLIGFQLFQGGKQNKLSSNMHKINFSTPDQTRKICIYRAVTVNILLNHTQTLSRLFTFVQGTNKQA